MIHLVTLNPALDLELDLREPARGKIGEVLFSGLEAGGKALNIARFLGKFRVPLTAWLGTGGGSHPTHVLYRSLLEREGLKVRFLSAQAPLRLNVVVREGKKSRKYNHPGFELDLVSFGQLDRAVKRSDLLVLTGRLPRGMNPSLYASWVTSFQRKGVRVIVDASGVALRQALLAKPWFFKVNLFELSEAFGQKFTRLAQVVKFWPKLIKAGLPHGAVTNGAEGALIWVGSEKCLVKSTRKVKSSIVVGAGDGFLAGYLRAFSAGKNFWDCARVACATATVVAQTGIQGFEGPLVNKMVKSVKVTRCE